MSIFSRLFSEIFYARPLSRLGLLSLCTIIVLLLDNAGAEAHGTERGMVMLLPTGYYLLGGALAVALSFAALLFVPDSWFRAASRARLTSESVPVPPVMATSLLSAVLLLGLVATGLYGTADPLENPLPLFVWTFFWVGFTLVQALFGNLWPWFNPWSGPLALLRLATRRPIGILPLLTLPRWLGHAPAIAVFLFFAWYELVSLAPEDPSRLAIAVAAYWLFTLAAMIIFGEEAWAECGEPFSVYFRMIGMLSPIAFTAPSDRRGGTRFCLSWPGQRTLERAAPPLSAAFFLLVTLGTASFDGFSETFAWLAAVGINPLEFPGRSAVMVSNSFGLVAAPLVLSALYAISVLLGGYLAGARDWPSLAGLLRHLVYSIIPISIAFHAAHYLTLLLVNSQYLYAVISDPFSQGWNLFGTADWHVTTSFLTNIDNVQVIWISQTVIIVLGHCIGILLAHMIALRHFGSARKATVSQIFLAMVMIFYTTFGLWLLSTPTVG